MLTSLIKGLWTALKTPKLVLLLWLWTLLLGLAAAMPARAWFSAALDRSPEAAGLLTRFSFGTFADLSKYHAIGPLTLLVAGITGIAIVALAGSAFVGGGMIEVIGSPADARTFMHRFFRGGGHFFWRFVRLAVTAAVLGGVAVAVTAAAAGAAVRPFTDSEWEPAGMFWGLVTAGLAGLVGLWFVLALDYARIRTARDGSRGMVRVYLGSLGFVARRLVGTYVIALACLAVTGALLVAYVAHEAAWTMSSWAAIGVLIATQQVIVLARAGVRVTQVAAEWHYYAAAVPVIPAVTPAAPVVAAAVEPAPAVPTEPPAGPATGPAVDRATPPRQD
jgi:hypothetical protein